MYKRILEFCDGFSLKRRLFVSVGLWLGLSLILSLTVFRSGFVIYGYLGNPEAIIAVLLFSFCITFILYFFLYHFNSCMQNLSKKFWPKVLGLLVFLWVFCFSLIIIVPLIPGKSRLNNHLRLAATEINTETFAGDDYGNTFYLNQFKMRVDDYTDSMMLSQEYLFDAQKPITSAISMSFFYTSGQNGDFTYLRPTQGLLYGTDEDDSTPAAQRVYLQSWIGSHVILRPMLTVFTHDDVRMINFTIHLLLIVLMAVFLTKKTNLWIALAFAASMAAIRAPFYTLNYWQLTPQTIGMLSSLFFLKFEFKRFGRIILFVFCGVAEAFFDFPLPPIVPFLMPMFTMLLFDYFHEKNNSLKTLWQTGISGIVWGASLLSTWALKWVIGFALIGANTKVEENLNFVEQLLSKFTNWSGNTFQVTYLSLMKTLINQLFGFHKFGVLVFCAVIFAIAGLAYVFRNKAFIRKNNGWFYVCLFGLFVIPYVWYAFTINHTFVHSFYVFRAQVVSVWIVLTIPAILVSKPKIGQAIK